MFHIVSAALNKISCAHPPLLKPKSLALGSHPPPPSPFDGILTQGFNDVAGLRELFLAFGPVSECHVPTNRTTGISKGFAFVEFKSSRHADL